MGLTLVELLTALAATQVTHRRCWPRQRSFTEYVAFAVNWASPYGPQDLNFGRAERPRHPYQHPIFQKIVNITWFQDKDDIGIVFDKYFAPISFGAIALAATAVSIEASHPCLGI